MKCTDRLGITFIYVTHDQEEALTMSDTIVVMKDGVIQQIANPQKIYDEPANAFVADFIGESDVLSGTFIKDCLVDVLGHQLASAGTRASEKGTRRRHRPFPRTIELLPEDDERAYLFGKGDLLRFQVGDHFSDHGRNGRRGEKRAFNTQQLCKRRKSARGRSTSSPSTCTYANRIINELATVNVGYRVAWSGNRWSGPLQRLPSRGDKGKGQNRLHDTLSFTTTRRTE